MRESTALRYQARSDLEAANLLGGGAAVEGMRAQVIAKAQQTIEKSVKSAMVILIHAGVQIPGIPTVRTTNALVPKDHKVARYAEAVGLLTAGQARRAHPPAIVALAKVLDPELHVIRSLDALAPAWPPAGGAHERNTEYPYEDTANDWLPPCEPGAFRANETRWYFDAATRVLAGVDRIVASLELMYP